MSSLKVITIGVLFGLLGALFLGSVHAKNLGQFDSDTDRAKWFRDLKQPDSPSVSCCGESDAYYCDELHSATNLETNETTNSCIITDDRDDAPLGRVHVPIGTEIVIPNQKMMTGNQIFGENPTGHNIVFLSSARFVWCFVLAGGV